jgi:cardiolipin synthase A/B
MRSLWQHLRRASPRVGIVLSVLAPLATGFACATPPSAEDLASVSPERPQVEGPRGPLSYKESRAILDKLRRQGGGSDVLGRHLAIEEAVADRPLTIGNKVTLLRDGPETYASMFAAMRAARRHINAEFFIVDSEGVGREFADLLIEKRAAGLEVNLIYDAVGSSSTPGEYFDRLRAGGVNVLEASPVNPLKAHAGWNPNRRDHRKLLVVDGKIAFTGGINISTTYEPPFSSARKAQPHEGGVDKWWRDTCVRVEGPAVADFQRAFLEQWQAKDGPPLGDADFFPPLPRAGDAVVRVMATTGGDDPPPLYTTLLSAIRNAESRVYLTQSYFVPPKPELEALADAARRGVDVRLILPSNTDQPKVVYAGRAAYQPLLDAGARIFERGDVLLHAKTVVIDGVWSTVGSANIDNRSVEFNDEINALVLGREFGTAMEAMFADDLARSKEVDPAAWAQRPLGDRVKEWFASLLDYWL